MQDASYNLLRLGCGIYLVTFKRQYDAAMHFLRAQIFYEGPDGFRGEQFAILDYMEYYALKKEGCNGTFSFPIDWVGFNVPDWVFEKLYVEGNPPDMNSYDVTMRAIYETIYREHEGKFILLGLVENSTSIDHEVAHGLYYVDDEYKEEQDKLLEDADKDHHEKITWGRQILAGEGYADEVADDELQSYLATGAAPELEAALDGLGDGFNEVYERYVKKLTMPWRTVRHDV